jgi:hypothetical protein
MVLEAELIFACTTRGIGWEAAQDFELWELAAALGLHRLETRAERDQREIIEAKRDYFEETGEARMERLAGYGERRKQQAAERKQQRQDAKTLGRGS